MKTPRRRVVRSSNARNTARAINTAHSPKKWLARGLVLLDPRKFKENWLTKAGGIRAAKIAGVGFVMLLAVFLWFGKDLPDPNKINAKLGGQTTKFWDRKHEKVLYEVYGDKNRSLIAFDQMPTTVKQATIAIEDKDFYKHGAFSVFGIGRAFTGVLTRTNRGGGSTITQQYVKNALLTDQRTLSRKIKELILAIEIEQRYSKDEILKLYLNEIPYGSQAYGIQTASKTYFNKDAKDLTLDESAILAAMPQAPSYYSPYGPNTDALIARRNRVLTLMAEQGYITEKQAADAKATNTLAKIQPRQSRFAGVTAPHFVLYAQDLLSEKYGDLKVTEGGLDITTTLDLDKQKAAEEAVAENIATVRRLGGSNTSLSAADPKTGQILAMVGSYDFSDEQFGAVNVATSKRQPGSSFKPFAYATMFSKNYGPGTTVYDVKTDFGGGYVPKNYTNRFYGVQSFRSSLAGSLNIPAVKALYLAGIDETLDTAHNMGISDLKGKSDDYGLSLVLGSGEVKLVDMVNAYESFANGGVHYESTPILKVTDPNNKVLEDNTKTKTPKKVLDPQVAYMISNVLSDNSARSFIFGSNSPLVIPGKTVAVKTGTTTDYRDAWTVGYSTNLVAGVWAGNNDNSPMSQSASAVSAPIWSSFMRKALTGPNEQFKRPAGIKEVTLDATTGRLANDKTKNKRTDIFPSWYKPAAAGTSDVRIDKLSGKEATECTPELAIETNGGGSVLPEIPSNDPSYNRWNAGVIAGLGFSYGSTAGGTGGKDDRHSCSDTKPTVDLDVSGSGTSYTFKATATSGTFVAKTIEIKVDGQIIGTKQINGNDSYTVSYTASPGSHTVTATVIDEGYYSDSESKNFTAGGAATLSGSASRVGNTVTITWTSDGSANYVIKIDGVTKYSGGYSSPKAYAVSAGAHTWTITSTNDPTGDGGSI